MALDLGDKSVALVTILRIYKDIDPLDDASRANTVLRIGKGIGLAKDASCADTNTERTGIVWNSERVGDFGDALFLLKESTASRYLVVGSGFQGGFDTKNIHALNPSGASSSSISVGLTEGATSVEVILPFLPALNDLTFRNVSLRVEGVIL